MNATNPIKNVKGLTLIEILITISILALIGSFAIPNYRATVRKGQERDAISQLRSIHALNLMYFSNNNSAYLDTGTGDLAQLNQGLGLNIMANGNTYAYTRGATPTTYTATATLTEGATTIFTLRVTEVVIGAPNRWGDQNPCCASGTGTCFLVADCV